MFWCHALVIAAITGGLAVFVVHPSDPRKPVWHRLVCAVPLALIAGIGLAVAGSG